jgi:HK97 family phage major capsid protein
MMTTRKEVPKDFVFHRSIEIGNRAIDEDKRTVEIAFSSEAEVDRWYGTEVLAHGPENVRLGRINNGGAFLMEHDRNDQIGVVERAWIDDDKKGRAIVKFSKSQRANEIFEDVKDGIRRLVSVGYLIHGEETRKLEGGREAVRAVDWEPYELSLVSIPADDSVGVGRAMENNQTEETQKNNIMSDTITDQAAKAAKAPEQTRSVEVINERPTVDLKQERENAIKSERARIDSINGIAEAAKTRGLILDANKAIRDGLSAQDFQNDAFQRLTEKHTDYTPASNLSRGEQRDLGKFDLGKALRASLTGKQLDGIEREIIQEGEREAERSGIGVSKGVTLPGFYVKRDMTATGGTGGDQGGMTIATNKAGLLDDFFNASIMRQLGATVLTGLVGNIDVPRLIAGTASGHEAENGAADEVSPTTAQLTMAPRRLPAFIDLSDQLLFQSSSAIESMIRGSLTAQMLATQEAAFFHGAGSGSNQPAGIAGTSGIGSVVGGTNGAAPTYANMIALEEKVDAQNAIMGSLAYVSNGQIRAKLKQTPKQSSGVEGNFIINDSSPNVINGYRAEFTNAVSRTLTKGTSSGVCSAIFFGNFADYVIGYWGGLNLELLRDSTNAKTGLHTLVANTYYDGGVRRPKSFSAMLDALGA